MTIRVGEGAVLHTCRKGKLDTMLGCAGVVMRVCECPGLASDNMILLPQAHPVNARRMYNNQRHTFHCLVKFFDGAYIIREYVPGKSFKRI